MKAFNNNPQGKLVFTFAFAVTALVMLIMASIVEMPLSAIFIAIAVSDIIMLGIVLFGERLPFGKK